MTDPDARRELARQAKELKDDPAFQAAVQALRKQWFGELMTLSDEGAMVRMTLKIQALEALPQQLQVFINDEAMAQRKKIYG
jgi:hypothetical protein